MEIYEGDIRKWIASIADSEKRNVAAQTFLKSCIETRNPVFNKLIEEMEHVATHSTAPVLLSGPTGSGKSHLARKIYELRYNKGLVPGSFVEVNCATLQGESVLSNLFGHVRGSLPAQRRCVRGCSRRRMKASSSLTKSRRSRSRYR